MNHLKDFEIIEDYLFGKMTLQEKNAFEAKMNNDRSLKERVEWQRLEHEAMELDLRGSLRAVLNEWKKEKLGSIALEDKHGKAKIRRLPIRNYMVGIAVAASVILVVGLWVLMPSSNNVALSNQFFETSSTISRSENNNGLPQILIPGLTAIQEGAYEDAIEQLEQIDDPNFINQAKLLIGEIHYATGSFNQAASMFEEILENYQLINIRDQAEWNLTLTYLAQKSTVAKGEALLERILQNKDHSHYPEAEQLVQQKNKSWRDWF